MDLRFLIRRYFLAIYWLAFAILAVDWGQYPGFILDPVMQPYPWREVGVTWGVLAVQVAILYAILRPVTFQRSWGRLGFALLYGVVLLAISAFTFGTDRPGYYYVPACFSAVTMLALVVIALALWLAGLWHRGRHAL